MNFWTTLDNGLPSLLRAALLTLRVSLIAIGAGTLLGVLMGSLLVYARPRYTWALRAYVDLIRSLPGLVLVFLAYYPLGFLLQTYGVTLAPSAAGTIALAAFGAADVAEITRGALAALPRGQIEAGRAIGLKFFVILRRIVFPQVALQMIPPWANTATEIVKGTTLLALIGATELLLTARQLTVAGFALPVYCTIGLIFFVINTALQMLGQAFEHRTDYERLRQQKVAAL